jgi:hypothetical protein
LNPVPLLLPEFLGVGPLEYAIRDLQVHSLRAHVDLCHAQCEALAEEFESAKSSLKRTRLARLWDATLKRGYMMQLLIDLLERQRGDNPKMPPGRVGSEFSGISALRRRVSDTLSA